MKKRGLSAVVTTLIIILLVMVAIAIVWIVISNVIQSGAEEIALGKFTVDAEISNVNINNSTNNVSFSVKRKVGQGNISGIKFIFYTNDESEEREENISLQELETRSFNFHLSLNVSNLIRISIVPLFKTESGRKVIGNIIATHNVGGGSGGSSGSTGGLCTPTANPCGSRECGNVQNGTCGSVSCGTCGSGVCNASGQCAASCTPATCSSLGHECGSWANGTCAGTLNCGTCSGSETCVGGTCVETTSLPTVNGFTPTPPPSGYPNHLNTGLTNPSLLSTDLSSLTEVSLGWEAYDNQIVENLEIPGRLILRGDNITVRNCRLWGDPDRDGDGFYQGYGIAIYPGTGIIIENCEIGKNESSWPNHIFGAITSMSDDARVDVIFRNNYFRFLHDGMFLASQSDAIIEATIENNYFVYIQAEDGEPGHDIDDYKGDGFESNGPLYNTTIRHNSMDVPTEQTSCILVQSNWGNVDNITVTDNWMNGAGYSLKVRKRTDTDKDFTNPLITYNRFGRDYQYGVFDSYDFEPGDLTGRVYGNIWADTEEEITSMNQ